MGVNFEVQDREPPQFTAEIPDQYFFANMEINPIAIPVTDNVGVVRLATNKDAALNDPALGTYLSFDGLNWR